MGRLTGKVALVTGGGVGIGAAVVKAFVREQAKVVITGRRKEVIDELAGQLNRTGGHVVAVAGSVTDEQHVRSTVAQVMGLFGKLDILVNNAGIGAFGKTLHETDDATWNALMDVNVTGSFRFIRAAVPAMLKSGGGAIINISSIAGTVGLPLGAAYGATKGAIDALTRHIAVDYAKQGIRCNIVAPGLIATPMAEPLLADSSRLSEVMSWYPMARPGRAEEVASLVVYLASDESSWVTGGTFPVDGGRTAQ